jgi:hypothetical protein
MLCMGEVGVGGVRETKGSQGQLTSSKGPRRMGNSCHEEPFKVSYLISANMDPLDFVCVQNKKSSLCRLKINHLLGSNICVYAWYSTPVLTVANSYSAIRYHAKDLE